MAIVESDQRWQLKIDYKPEYDSTGELDLAAWQQTFSYVDEDATAQQLYDYVVALADLTVYRNAPYRVTKVQTSTLKVG